jgi:hypothetical protein
MCSDAHWALSEKHYSTLTLIFLTYFLPSFYKTATMYVPGVDFFVNYVLCGAMLGARVCVACALRCCDNADKRKREREGGSGDTGDGCTFFCLYLFR